MVKKYYKKNYPKTKADKALMLVRKVMKNNPIPELGSIPFNQTQLNMDQVNSFILLNGMVRGDDISDRDKRIVKLHSIYLKWIIQHNVIDTIGGVCRIAIVLDKQPNGAAFTSSDLLSDITPIDNVNSLRNLSNRKRFKLLKDIRVTTTSAGSNQSRCGEIYLNLKGITTVFNSGNTGAISDITSNAIYIYYVSTSALNAPEFSYHGRLRFYDN